MGKKENIDLMVEGGNAKADASMSQRLGPLKINIQDILSKINEKTASFKGMKIPVKVSVDIDTKEFELTVGTPPTTELIKNEIKLQKGSGKPDKEKVGNISIEQVIKIAKMKEDSLLDNSIKARIKSVAGSCNSLGVLIEGKNSAEFNKDLEAGKFDKEVKEEKTEVSPEKLKILKEQLEIVKDILKKEQEKLAKEAPVKEEKKEEKKEEGKEEGKEESKEEKKEEGKKEEKKGEKKKEGKKR